MYFRSRAQQRRFCLQILIGSAAIFAASFFLGKFSNTDSYLGDVSSSSSVADFVSSSSFLRDKRIRLLRFSQEFFDPKSTAPRIKNTVTIYLTRDSSDGTHFNPALSIFKTDALQRYGTGRIQYIIREHAECDLDCNIDAAALQQEPCLAVTRNSNKDMWCDIDHLKCNYPQCKTMVTNDEMCSKVDAFDSRQYFTSDGPDFGGYLPLGPRLGSWQSLLEIARLKNPHFFNMPASKRKFAFNAVFSQTTNRARQKLAVDIEHQGSTSKLPVFTSIMTERDMDANDPNNRNHNQLRSDDYMEVMLDSIFTLSPAGHNPECFRIFEAVEAGSIPVLSRDDLHGAHHPNQRNREHLNDLAHPCQNALVHWYGAPIVVLDSWSELYPTIEGLLKDPAALDEMQDKLIAWYGDYMRRVVSKFEDFMLDSTSPVASESPVDSPPGDSINIDLLST